MATNRANPRNSAHTKHPRKRSALIMKVRRIAESDRISGLIMLGFALLGFVCANLPVISGVFARVSEFVIAIPFLDLHLSVNAWVQDAVLTIFFLAVGLDLKQELTTGSLSNIKTAAVPMIAAVGGMIVPPVFFLGIVSIAAMPHGGVETVANGQVFPLDIVSRGWPVPTATDIAFSLAVLALFAKALPGTLRAFLMTLATVDDLLGIILIAVLFSHFESGWWALGIIAGAAIWAWSVRRERVPWVLVVLSGLLMWYSMHELGIHPTLSGVLAGLLVPGRPVHGDHDARTTRYLVKIEPFSALLALPIFAFFSAGIHFDVLTARLFISPVVIGIVLALVFGKPLGIIVASWVSTHVLGLRLAHGLKVRDLIPIASACGIGFTVAFLMTSLAFHQPELSNEARFGVLIGSLISAAIASVLLKRQSDKFARASQTSEKLGAQKEAQ